MSCKRLTLRLICWPHQCWFNR